MTPEVLSGQVEALGFNYSLNYSQLEEAGGNGTQPDQIAWLRLLLLTSSSASRPRAAASSSS